MICYKENLGPKIKDKILKKKEKKHKGNLHYQNRCTTVSLDSAWRKEEKRAHKSSSKSPGDCKFGTTGTFLFNPAHTLRRNLVRNGFCREMRNAEKVFSTLQCCYSKEKWETHLDTKITITHSWKLGENPHQVVATVVEEGWFLIHIGDLILQHGLEVLPLP